MSLKTFFCLTAATAALGLAGTSSAQLIDDMSNTSNFGNIWGGDQVTANGNNTVTITRTVANQDAGVSWGCVGGDLQLSTESQLTLTPVGTDNGGWFNVNILLFNSSGSYIMEGQWLGDNQATTPQTVDVAQWALDHGHPEATQYWLHIRIDPYGQAGADYTFGQIAAVPEPGSALLLLTGLPLLWLARRNQRQG